MPNPAHVDTTYDSFFVFFTLKGGAAATEALRQELIPAKRGDQNEATSVIQAAVHEVGLVHFSQFIVIPELSLFVINTSFDGDFDDYLTDFTDRISPIFDKLLPLIADPPPPVVRVSDNRQAFEDYVKQRFVNCRKHSSLFSPYGHATALEIQAQFPPPPSNTGGGAAQ